MEIMKAVMLTAPDTLTLKTMEKPRLEKGQVLVRVEAASLNRRDQWIKEGKYPNIQMNKVLGSDAAGTVVELHENAGPEERKWLHKKVVINPNINWGADPSVQSLAYTILGMPSDGTMRRYMALDIDRLFEKPLHLDSVQAAALPLAGLTAYRAVFRHAQVKNGDKVLISGFGGGVAQFAFQMAHAVGARVYVSSGSEDKIGKAKSMGAIEGFDYREKGWQKKAKEITDGFDVVIDSAGGNQLSGFIKIMRPGGKIVFYGATNGLPPGIDLYRMFWNQITLQGSTMGNDQEFEAMVRFIIEHRIVPLIGGVWPVEEVQQAFDTLAEGRSMGKLILYF